MNSDPRFCWNRRCLFHPNRIWQLIFQWHYFMLADNLFHRFKCITWLSDDVWSFNWLKQTIYIKISMAVALQNPPRHGHAYVGGLTASPRHKRRISQSLLVLINREYSKKGWKCYDKDGLYYNMIRIRWS